MSLIEEINPDRSIEKVQEADVNQLIKRSNSAEERRFLLELCKTYHVSNIDKLILLDDWVRLGVVSLSHLKETAFGISERIVLITNELYTRHLSENCIQIFYSGFIENIDLFADEEFVSSNIEIKKELKKEFKRLTSKEMNNLKMVECNSQGQSNSKEYDSAMHYSHPKNIDHQSTTDKSDFGGTDFAASIIPYTERHIRELCRKKLIPFEKPVGKYIFNRQKLEEWALTYGSNRKKEKLRIGRYV